MEYQRAQLKQNVKQAIKDTRPRPIWVTLLYLVIVSVGAGLIQRLLSGLNWAEGITSAYAQLVLMGVEPDQAAQILLGEIWNRGVALVFTILLSALVAEFILSLWKGLMLAGYEGYCLAVVRRQNPGPLGLFQVFHRVVGVLVTQFFKGLFTFLWSFLFTCALIVEMLILLVAVGLGNAGPVLNIVAAILILAGVIACVVGLTWVSLRYSMVDYVMLDQGLTGLDALRSGKELMRGNYLRLFILQLSFIGWYLVLAAILGVGVLIVLAAGAGVAAGVGDFVAFMGVFWLAVALMAAGVGVVSLWLQPYLTGSMAGFYDFLRSGRIPQLPLSGDGSCTGGNGGYTGDYSSYTWTDKASQSGQSEGWGQPPQEPQEPQEPQKPQGPEQPRDGEGRSGEDPENPKDPPPSGPSYPKY